MAVHWVNYDLLAEGQDYDALIDYLKSHDGWAKPLKSSFFVKTDLSVAELRDGISSHIDTNDVVVVVAVSGANWGTRSVSKEVTDWMKKHM